MAKKSGAFKKRDWRKLELIKNWNMYLMALPVVALCFVFSYLPIAGVWLAFEKYTIQGGIFGSEFVGFNNFKLFFDSSDFLRLTRNVFVINLSNMVVGTLTTVVCAIILDQLFQEKVKKLYQTILFLPYFLSILIVVRFVDFFFDDTNGIINSFLQQLGFKAVVWSDNAGVWVPIVVGASAWKGLGYGIIVYLATITGIDDTLYEAARLDGAGRMRQIRSITLPMLKPTIVLLILMNIGRIFYGDFMFIYSFVGDNYVLKEWLDIIETYLFRNLTGGKASAAVTPDYGLNAAIGLYQSLLGFVMIFGSNFIVKRIDKDLALF